MPTTVGTEADEKTMIGHLINLEHDAIAAYESVIDKLDNASHKERVTAFKADHDQQVAELRSIAAELGMEASSNGDFKKLLTTGKIALANLGGDKAILRAMKTNEDDTVQAYQQARDNSAARPEWRSFFEKALADEERHRAWFASAE
ncbi:MULTISPECIES: ferritin-like domain-containing protein [unclassified Roseitalea]|uniref:ferritin-like domain-containing protein n=1 Tax=unclassified Roseitalea TaxID=2639107 RepID=UPI00273FFD70|nr:MULTISPECIES: ferritin-like domain-containing protein [unclassified Roseitalea]